jgi:CubicO group peptidase (beta-lactamase class C family)
MSSLLTHLTQIASENHLHAAVRLTAYGDLLIDTAFGLADRDRQLPITPETRFGIASGTKLLTALGIGALIQGGTLGLDMRLHAIADFDLDGIHADVTIGQLLSHTSGVYDYYDEEVIEDFDAFELPIPPQQLHKPSDYLPMAVGGTQKFAPGERFAYSNGGYVILGVLIEQLTGDFHRHLQQGVLQPAGIQASGFYRFDALPENTALGYIETEGGWETNENKLPIIGGPDGGAMLSTREVEQLWQSLWAGKILAPDLLRRFVRKAAHSHKDKYYSHGVWILDNGQQPAEIYIEGMDAGVSFSSTCFGESIVATVISSTSSGAWPLAQALDVHIRDTFPKERRQFSFYR